MWFSLHKYFLQKMLQQLDQTTTCNYFVIFWKKTLTTTGSSANFLSPDSDGQGSYMCEALNSTIYICFHATAVGALLHIFRLICAANYDCCGALSGAKRLWINVIMRQLISPVAFVNQDFRMYNCMCSHEVWEMKFFHFHSI